MLEQVPEDNSTNTDPVSATTNPVQEEAITRLSGRSIHIQNVTTFGTGAVGQKIDGDLHAGGNDSYGNRK